MQQFATCLNTNHKGTQKVHKRKVNTLLAAYFWAFLYPLWLKLQLPKKLQPSIILFFSLILSLQSTAQVDKHPSYWHGIEREVRYQPEEEAIVIENGSRRFNRALYGGPSGFRVEAGDLPEFALYRPRLAGTLKLGLVNGTTSKWLIEAEQVKASYEPGKMTYTIQDSLLAQTVLHIEVLAGRDHESLLLRWRTTTSSPTSTQLLLAFGGASDERFSREGDIGADPESVFYLETDHCIGNEIKLQANSFELRYPARKGEKPYKVLAGRFPPHIAAQITDASALASPWQLTQSKTGEYPLWTGVIQPASEWQYAYLWVNNYATPPAYTQLATLFQKADLQRQAVASRVQVQTPDPYLNTLGGVLSIAADAIWEEPAYHHGAIAWRQQLVGWRGAYVADPLAWHDRARMHFGAYAKSQLTGPSTGPVTPDTLRHLARQVEKIGTAIFTEGYLSRYPGGERLRAHHYDMNQVYIDGLLRHLQWTGDLEFAREMWPVIQRHLDWEKRCFDTDGDGLYDAYCSIWASDAVQYSGGGVTHASAYHYYSNSQAAKIARALGEDPEPYELEAARILQALNKHLWLPDKGYYAEFKDLLGLQSLHTSPAVWTVYHAIDSEVPHAFQQYQLLDYVQQHIPQIPVRAVGLVDTNLYTISTTNWLPYTWSVNNVALAEVMHTALAYWQGGRSEEAFLLWKSALMESMYLGASPGSFQQLSFYDAMRGELYRDFADPIGMTARALVEGLYGIKPNLLDRLLTVTPGFPAEWDSASIELPDISLSYQRQTEKVEVYELQAHFNKELELLFRFSPRRMVESVYLNGEAVEWESHPTTVGKPVLQIRVPYQPVYRIEITYQDQEWGHYSPSSTAVAGQAYTLEPSGDIHSLQLHDPQGVWDTATLNEEGISGQLSAKSGTHTFFLEVAQPGARWWEAVTLDLKDPVTLTAAPDTSATHLYWEVTKHTKQPQRLSAHIGSGPTFSLFELTDNYTLRLPKYLLVPGTNTLSLRSQDSTLAQATYYNWQLTLGEASKFTSLPLANYFNASVNDIFEPQYWSPRPEGPTVQLPVTGIGNWCYPWVQPKIDDSGLRTLAGDNQKIELPSGITFAVSEEADVANTVFVSQWDRFPTEMRIPLQGQADHLYLLMAGTTNPMQSRLDNGLIEVTYTDGTTSRLLLRNPDNWVPIEQDYYLDGYAFSSPQPPPPRLHLKTGLYTEGDFDDYITIKGFTDTGIEGGAATLLDLELDPTKTLQSLTIKALANDVVIGLLAATLSKKQ